MAFLCNLSVCAYKPTNPSLVVSNSATIFQSLSTFQCQTKPPILKKRRVISASFSSGQNLETALADRSSSGDAKSGRESVKLTYLEGNSWLLGVDGVSILVDPVLVGNLDFGVPWLYDGAKKVLKSFTGVHLSGVHSSRSSTSTSIKERTQRSIANKFVSSLSDLPALDSLLITQSLDDHCHLATLKPLSELFPSLQVVATPNAGPILSQLFNNVVYIEPGESSEIEGKNSVKVSVRASVGPVLGPPWQRPENGYFIVSQKTQLRLYIEPHCVYDEASLQMNKADIIITPVIKQLLPSFTLVSGQEDAVKLAKLLDAKFVVAMNNGDLETSGILRSLLKAEGTINSFKALLSRELPGAQVFVPTPGVPLEVPPA